MTLRRFGSQQVPPYPRQLQVFGRKKQVVRSDVCQKAQCVSSAPAQCSSPRPDRRTVIGALEDAEDYKAFEAAIIADYDVQSAVERELVLRLASLLWRLRRATTTETGLFEIQADYLREFRPLRSSRTAALAVNTRSCKSGAARAFRSRRGGAAFCSHSFRARKSVHALARDILRSVSVLYLSRHRFEQKCLRPNL